eukprot:TRINITY_DN5160_c0_g1_i1.p1 TRINITY_DN5160_c0_g1~~TRINITY_DN5160_c0_g1_i1.p1  ORF type:complete len:393 (+),score=42.45 TRINITY_DN5160_c0_g1_i1:330-1508(+)
MVYGQRVIRMVAKDQLFTLPVLGQMLRAVGAVPVHRPSDHPEAKTDNTEMFKSLFEILYKGDCVSIFPEGTTVFEPHLQKLKTGTARLALGYVARYNQPVTIIPVGLNYIARDKFRSEALVTFGNPMVIGDQELSYYKQDEHKAVDDLTRQLTEVLEGLTVNAPDWSTLRLLNTARSLYIPEGSELSLDRQTQLGRNFARGYIGAVEQNKEQVVRLRKHLENYQLKLDVLGLTDQDVHRRNHISLRTLPGIICRGIFLWPLSFVGSVLNFPVGLCASVGGRLLARGEVVEAATYKLVAGFFSALVYYPLAFFGIYKLTGIRGVVAASAIIPISGYAAVSMRPFFSALSWMRTATRLVSQDLKEERKKLREEVIQVVNELYDPNSPGLLRKTE